MTGAGSARLDGWYHRRDTSLVHPAPRRVGARFGALGIGRAALLLGAGRERKGDRVDPGAGVEVLVKTGDRVEKGQPVARLYGGRDTERATELVLKALEISSERVERSPVILGNL
jgi:thymidine phosphorylase